MNKQFLEIRVFSEQKLREDFYLLAIDSFVYNDVSMDSLTYLLYLFNLFTLFNLM